jgi:hypothetical protein
MRIPDPDPGFDDLNWKKIYSWKFKIPHPDPQPCLFVAFLNFLSQNPKKLNENN